MLRNLMIKTEIMITKITSASRMKRQERKTETSKAKEIKSCKINTCY